MKNKDKIKAAVSICFSVLYVLIFITLIILFASKQSFYSSNLEQDFHYLAKAEKAMEDLRTTILIYAIIQGMRLEIKWILNNFSKIKRE